jgi:hypothetical protein
VDAKQAAATYSFKRDVTGNFCPVIPIVIIPNTDSVIRVKKHIY